MSLVTRQFSTMKRSEVKGESGRNLKGMFPNGPKNRKGSSLTEEMLVRR